MPLGLDSLTRFIALASSWWDKINDSATWQDGIFYALCGAYALVSSVALVLFLFLCLILDCAVHCVPSGCWENEFVSGRGKRKSWMRLFEVVASEVLVDWIANSTIRKFVLLLLLLVFGFVAFVSLSVMRRRIGVRFVVQLLSLFGSGQLRLCVESVCLGERTIDAMYWICRNSQELFFTAVICGVELDCWEILCCAVD